MKTKTVGKYTIKQFNTSPAGTFPSWHTAVEVDGVAVYGLSHDTEQKASEWAKALALAFAKNR